MSAGHKNEDRELYNLAHQVGELLKSKKCKITTAESCTGGWLSKVLTSVQGSSEWFNCAFVTYSNESKQRLLGVTHFAIRTYTSVSKQVTQEMAKGALVRSSSNVSIAITGVAGPKAVPPNPPGVAWITWATSGGKMESEKFELNGERNNIRYQIVTLALKGMIKRSKWLK